MQDLERSQNQGPSIYEDRDGIRARREVLVSELTALVDARRQFADDQRCVSPRPAAERRQEIVETLGWPLDTYVPGKPAGVEQALLHEDRYGQIFRIWAETLSGLRTYALLAIPSIPGPHPLVIAQHGGGGSPEQVMATDGKSDNYNDLGQRLRERNFAVLAPQLCLGWGEDLGLGTDQYALENALRHLGGSLAALEATRLRRCLDYVSARPDIDADRIGMAGLSYGGFYTLLIAALDNRIRAAYSSCFFNDRYRYPWGDLVWKGSAFRFLDPELAGLVAPRALYIDVGRKDEIFTTIGSEAAQKQARELYAQSGRTENLTIHIHELGHEVDRDDGPIDFLEKNLSG